MWKQRRPQSQGRPAGAVCQGESHAILLAWHRQPNRGYSLNLRLRAAPAPCAESIQRRISDSFLPATSASRRAWPRSTVTPQSASQLFLCWVDATSRCQLLRMPSVYTERQTSAICFSRIHGDSRSVVTGNPGMERRAQHRKRVRSAGDAGPCGRLLTLRQYPDRISGLWSPQVKRPVSVWAGNRKPDPVRRPPAVRSRDRSVHCQPRPTG